MRILINALSARLGGGQTYIKNLLNCLPNSESIEILLLTSTELKITRHSKNIQKFSVSLLLNNPIIRTIWERFYLPLLLEKYDIDVLFCPGGVVSTSAPKGCKTVTMFRNMIPFDIKQRKRYSYGYKRVRNWMLERIMLSSMRNADLVIFISNYAREVINQRLAGKMGKTVVIPHGISDAFIIPANLDTIPSWLPRGSYLLYVSSIDVYKMQIEVVRAFALLWAQNKNLKLILAGPEINPDYLKQLRKEIALHGLDNSVIIPGSVSYDKLPYLYQNAIINIFASECENCPNILLEMMASGRPVVCSNYPPMPEFGGDTVAYFDPENPKILAKELDELLSNSEQQERLATMALKRSNEYRWADVATRTWQAIAALSEKQT